MKLFTEVRNNTVEICRPLEIEDHVVQPMPEVSPPKWHLGHTTWFLEELILNKFQKDYRFYNQAYRQLYNSYYKGIGPHWVQAERGRLSRPSVKEVLNYRMAIDEQVLGLLNKMSNDSQLAEIITVALHHEQQHQELLFMDIKNILFANPLPIAYRNQSLPSVPPAQKKWLKFPAGIYEVGAKNDGFSYDNERPRHQSYLAAFSLCDQLVTNGEFLEFIKDGGYQNSLLWLSMGYDWIKAKNINHPMYWQDIEGQWHEYTLYGNHPLQLNAPVCHISYFEADAFARWRGLRLPSEEELEVAQREVAAPSGWELHPRDTGVFAAQLWCWSRSHYSAYPGFRPFKGALGEYNGKFMCNQFVLRGGCIATPAGHYRKTYRNFYEPGQRWMFSGIALAEDNE